MVILLTVFQKSLNVLYNTVKFSSGYFLLQFKKKKKGQVLLGICSLALSSKS